jgi:hypothetical protein
MAKALAVLDALVYDAALRGVVAALSGLWGLSSSSPTRVAVAGGPGASKRSHPRDAERGGSGGHKEGKAVVVSATGRRAGG